jgi:hypothetical protein
MLLLLFCQIFITLTRIFFGLFLATFLLVLLQIHVCHQLSTPGPPEDRGRAECLPSQDHEPQCPR